MIGVRVAFADLRHEWLLGICQILAMVAVLTPLLVLFGLKYGVVENLLTRLRQDPQSVQIRPVGDLRLDPERFAAIAAMPEVRFAVPQPRTIAQILYLRRPDSREGLIKATLVPTAPGDPLRAGAAAPLGEDEIVLTGILAQRLGVAIGDQVEGSNALHGSGQRLRFRFTVAEIASPERLEGLQALVHAANVDRLAAFLDGYAVPELGVTQGRPPSERRLTYETLRIYADGIDRVEPLVARLTAQPYEFDVRSSLGEIRGIRLLDSKLSMIFRLLVLVGSGYLVALAATSWASVMRKRRPLSVLRLLGMPQSSLLAFPVVQAVLLSGAAVVLSLLLFGVVAAVINASLGPDLEMADQELCRLEAGHMAIVAAVTLTAAAAASLIGGWQAARLQPVEGLRDA